jgi:hypothetical protein
VAATYCIEYPDKVLCSVFTSLTVEVSALAHRAVPTTTGYNVTLPWTEPSYSQQKGLLTALVDVVGAQLRVRSQQQSH